MQRTTMQATAIKRRNPFRSWQRFLSLRAVGRNQIARAYSRYPDSERHSGPLFSENRDSVVPPPRTPCGRSDCGRP